MTTRRCRAAWRLLRVALHLLHGLAIALLRFRSLDRAARRVLVQWWATKMLRVVGVTLQCDGTPAEGGVLLAINHVSWLDIVAIHAVCPQARFVSKADVGQWPLLSDLANAADTLYIERERRRDALRVVHAVAEALSAGDTVAVFPEGTTGAGPQLLPFHANLLQAAVDAGAPVQPAALWFADRERSFSEAVVYVGDTSLMQSLWRVACADGLQARLHWLAPQPSGGADRRILADALRTRIQAALPPA